MSESARRKATFEDLWAIPADERFHELIDARSSRSWLPAANTVTRRAESSARCADRFSANREVKPTGFPQRKRPDWICEVICPEKPTRDTVKKLRLYHHAQVPFYWLVGPTAMTLTVMRWSDAGYVTLLPAERGEVMRAQPFEAIEIAVGTLFGDDPPA